MLVLQTCKSQGLFGKVLNMQHLKKKQKSVDASQPARTVQADMRLFFLQQKKKLQSLASIVNERILVSCSILHAFMHANDARVNYVIKYVNVNYTTFEIYAEMP